MQILHWHIPHPHPGTEASANISNLIGRFSPRQGQGFGFIHYPQPSTSSSDTDPCPRIKELLRGTKPLSTTTTMNMEVSIPSYLNNNVKPPTSTKTDPDILESEYDQSAIHGSNSDVLTAAGDERRHNSGGDDEPPGDHRRDLPRKRKPEAEIEESQSETEDSEFVYDAKGTRYRRSDKAMLIINLYPENGRNGYTFQFFVPENDLEEARLYDESHIISYSENYLLDSINSETVPIELLHKLESENGIDLMRYRNCVVCEIRDYRRFPHVNSDPVIRRVVLRPTNQTIYYDFDKLILKSYEDKKLYTKLLKARSIDYDFSVSATKRKKWDADYPFSYNHLRHLDSSTPYDEDSDGDELTLDQINELEKQLVKSIAPGLCLDPSKQVGLIANRVQFERFKWDTKEMKDASKKFDLDLKKKIVKANISESEEEFEEEENEEEDEVSNAQFYERRNSSTGIQFPFNSLFKYLQKKQQKVKNDDAHVLRLPQLVYQEYPANQLPTNTSHDVMFKRISEPPSPSSFRQIFPENLIHKTEEYLFETERRKRPHRTKLSIYQRNHVESYFGELEQEAFLDNLQHQQQQQENPNFLTLRSPISTKPIILDPPSSNALGSKCQFELGSIDSVSLYIKQFTDIFTEDGRRPCKITYQKQGQAGPHTIFTSSYKQQQQLVNGNNNNNSATPNNQTQTPIGPQLAPPPLTNQKISISISSSQCTPSQPTVSTVSVSAPTAIVPVSSSTSSQPPVQIVYPQPRPQPIQQQISASSIAQATSSLPVSISIPTSASIALAPIQQQSTIVNGTNVNLNLSLNSSRLLQHPQIQRQQQQVLTRPQMYQTSQQPMTRPPVPVPVSVSQQIITNPQPQPQTQGIRLKQQALATLLVAGLTGNSLNSTGAKPITVAIQPQPQNPIVSTNQLNMNQVLAMQNEGHQITHSQVVQAHHQQQQHQGNHHQSPIMIMLSSPAGGNGQNHSNVPSHHHSTPGLSVNLNTINLESLLASSVANASQNYITSTAVVQNSNSNNQFTMVPTNSGNSGLNILRLSNNTNTVTLQPQQILTRTMNTPQLVNMNTVSTGILIQNQNSNPPTLTTTATIGVGPQQRTPQHTTTLRTQPPDLQEIQVPDLNALLSSGIGPRNQQTYTTRTTPTGTSIDLNLNVNLNLSGPHPQHQQHHSQPVSGNRSTPNGQVYDHSHTSNGGVNVNFDESIFNALSDAIGPDLGQKLENSLGPPPPPPSSTTPTKSSSSIITLQELLGSPPMIVHHQHQQSPNVPISLHNRGASASPLNSPQSPSITSILSPVSPNVTTSSIQAYTTATPRLNALLAGTPSADSSTNATLVGSNLLERLMSAQPASSQQSQSHQSRPGGSRLNPIATATPNVVLDHPVLAATLTQGPQSTNLRQALTRPQFRQIAPAPPPTSSTSSTTSTSATMIQPQHSQQQLLNLLGLPVVSSSSNSSPSTIRINGPQSTGPPPGSNVGSR